MRKGLLYCFSLATLLMGGCHYMPVTRGWAIPIMAEQQVNNDRHTREISQLHEEIERLRRNSASRIDLGELRKHVNSQLDEIAHAQATSADHQVLADRLREVSRQIGDLSRRFDTSEQEGAKLLQEFLKVLRDSHPPAQAQ